MSAHANMLWARCFADELARHGVREVVVAPGSRSTPLVLACAGDERFRMRVHLDERSAAFFAVGVGKATGRPAVVITTSGTATANVFPAVVEAFQSGVPLVVLTADRPHHLRDSDANQAIDQVRLYGRFTRASFDVAPPRRSAPALRHLRTLAGRAVAAAQEPSAGPVHLNFPFDKPLQPSAERTETGADGEEGDRPVSADLPSELAGTAAVDGRPDGVPFVQIVAGRRRADEGELPSLAALLGSGRGVIVAGPTPRPERTGAPVLELAAATGFPLLADPLSGARYGPSRGAQRIAAYDLILGDHDVAERLEPSVIVRTGASPTSAAVLGWLARHDEVPQLVIDGDARWKDHGATATHYVTGDAAATLEALTRRVDRVVSEAWSAAWGAAESAALAAIAARSDPPHEGHALAAVAQAAPPGTTLFVSSSMPVRDLDAYAHPRDEEPLVYGNRGASGIDGIVSTAFGVATQREGPTICVLGDVAFFHDQNGLLWAREQDATVVFVLIDNDGGGIFHMLPIVEHEPHFTPYFATPHGLDLRHAVEMHGLSLRDTSIPALAQSIEDTLAAGTTSVVRVRTDRDSNRSGHEETREAVARAVREALAEHA